MTDGRVDTLSDPYVHTASTHYLSIQMHTQHIKHKMKMMQDV